MQDTGSKYLMHSIMPHTYFAGFDFVVDKLEKMEFNHVKCELLCLRWCASDVCLSDACIGPKSRTERPRKTQNWHRVTRDSDTLPSRSKGQLAGGGDISWRPPTQLVLSTKSIYDATVTKKACENSLWYMFISMSPLKLCIPFLWMLGHAQV